MHYELLGGPHDGEFVEVADVKAKAEVRLPFYMTNGNTIIARYRSEARESDKKVVYRYAGEAS